MIKPTTLSFPLSELSTPLLLFTLVLTLAHIGTQVALPWVLGDVVDSALIGRNQGELNRLILILIGLAAVAAIARAGSTLTRVRVAEGGILRIKRKVISAVLEAPLLVSEREPSGTYQAMLVNDGTKVRQFLASALPEAFYALVQLVVLSAVILVRFPQACWIAALLVPAYVLVPGILTPRIRACSRDVQRTESDESLIAGEMFAGVRDIKASGTTAWARRRARTAATGAAQARYAMARWQSLLAVDYFVYWIVVGSVYLIGGRQVVQGAMTVGELIALVAYLSYLQGPLWRLIESYNELQKLSPSLDKLKSVLSFPRQGRQQNVRTGTGRTHSPPLVLEGVMYAYPGAAGPVLDTFSLALGRGEIVCLSGPSGTGKTTLLKLLIRLLEADGGNIRVEGRAVGNWSLPALRRTVSVLFESAPMWSCSVLDNITEGRRPLDRAVIDRAVRGARVDEFINELANGLHTEISSGAAHLSAGQRQRLRLARAMVRTPMRILALDEPTVHLDSNLTAEIMTSLRAVAEQGTSVLIVTHDPLVASWCDREVKLRSTTMTSRELIYAT